MLADSRRSRRLVLRDAFCALIPSAPSAVRLFRYRASREHVWGADRLRPPANPGSPKKVYDQEMAYRNQPPSRLRKLLDALKRLLKREPEPPEDPYAYVAVRLKPRPGGRSAAAVVEEPENY